MMCMKTIINITKADFTPC